MNKFTEYILPEYVFIDGNSHEGDKLEGRTVMQHIRSATILEVFDLSEIKAHAFRRPTYEFEYTNRFGIIEKHLFVAHFSLMWDSPYSEVDPDHVAMEDILKSCARWYCDYLTWEDKNIEGEGRATRN